MAGNKVCCPNLLENGNDTSDRGEEEEDEPNVDTNLEDDLKEVIEGFEAPEFFEFSTCTCYICNGYYGPCFGEPVCSTCHAFLFPDDIGSHQQGPITSEKTDDEDSGNDEPVDLYYNAEQRESQADHTSQESTPIMSSPSDSPDQNRPYLQVFNWRYNNVPVNNAPVNYDDQRGEPSRNEPHNLHLDLGHAAIRQDVENYPQHDVLEDDFQSPEEDSVPVEEPIAHNPVFPAARNDRENGEPSRPWNLSARLEMLTNYRHFVHNSVTDAGLVERLPPEVLLAVFSHLDDVSLWCAANVCRRWHHLLSTHITQQQWQQHVKLRWPLYKPKYEVRDWYKVYDHLASSSPCKTCLSQTSLRAKAPKEGENSWRRNRLRMELKAITSDPPEGIAATPFDPLYTHWQATITGPAGSPYEGGLFYLYLRIPYSYPMAPPVVRFLTKILHPNVSRHGDVGIDSIHHNWSLALTLPKVLISVQSLLTDPYCVVCMEPELGEMYLNNRARFEEIARSWTCKYAMDSTCNELND